MRQTYKRNYKRARKLIAWSLITTLSLASIAGYVALSITLNGPPPNWSFDGNAFLIQPASESNADKVQLSFLVNTSGNLPIVSYTVSACGPRPYSVDFILTGNAQIQDARFPIYASPLPPRMQRFPSRVPFHITLPANSNSFMAGTGQFVTFDLPKSPCQQNTSPPMFEIQGFLSAPLQQSWSGPWGLWHGPHASQSWPELGSVAAPPGPFILVGIAGKWALPSSLDINAATDAIIPGWSVDSTMPGSSTPNTLAWSSANDISASGQLTDTASVSLLQDWIVICAIGFGIGGAMLASLLFDWIRPQRRESDQQNFRDSNEPIIRSWQPHPKKHQASTRLVLLGLALIIGYARKRHQRYRP